MGAQPAISVEEYLHTSFPDHDREYRDGEIVERRFPDYPHGRTQAILVAWFLALRTKFPVFPSVETRMQLRPGLIFIPDVSVFYPSEPERFPRTPPFVVIEVLSTDDRLSAVREKLEEYKSAACLAGGSVWKTHVHLRRRIDRGFVADNSRVGD